MLGVKACKSSYSPKYFRCLMLCISISFWVLGAPENLLKYPFWPISIFLFIFIVFGDFSSEVKKKRLQKQCFKLLFKASWHANASQLPSQNEKIKYSLFSCKPQTLRVPTRENHVPNPLVVLIILVKKSPNNLWRIPLSFLPS